MALKQGYRWHLPAIYQQVIVWRLTFFSNKETSSCDSWQRENTRSAIYCKIFERTESHHKEYSTWVTIGENWLVGWSRPAFTVFWSQQQGSKSSSLGSCHQVCGWYDWLKYVEGQVRIYGATNNAKERRKYERSDWKQSPYESRFWKLFVKTRVLSNTSWWKWNYTCLIIRNLDPETALQDFERRNANDEVTWNVILRLSV